MNDDFKELIDLDSLYKESLDECSKNHGGYRLNFGVYYTPRF